MFVTAGAKIHKSVWCYRFWFVITANANWKQPDLGFIKCCLFRKSYHSTGGRRGLQRGRGVEGIVWGWAKKLICLECFLSFLIWLSFSFKPQWLDGIRHTTELFCSVFYFGLLFIQKRSKSQTQIQLRKLCLSLIWIEKQNKQQEEQQNRTNRLLSIKKQINPREKPSSLQHPGPTLCPPRSKKN